MTRPGRRRADDWTTSHARARSDLSDRLDGLIEPGEAAWLDDHLAACGDCRSAAADYESQRSDLRSAVGHPPEPPRDLWARTAAAIERESRFRDGRTVAGARSSWLRNPLLASALVVVVAVGTLISSQLSHGGATPARSDAPTTAVASDATVATPAPGSTPIIVGEHVQWISRGEDGRFRVTNWEVNAVCPKPTDDCASLPPVEEQPVQLTTEPTSVFGSGDGKQLIVVDRPGTSDATSISVVRLEPSAAPPSSTPSVAPSASVPPASDSPAPASSAPTATPHSTPSPSQRSASATPVATPSDASPSPASPSVAVSPSATPGGPVQIAQDVILVGQSAAYSPDFQWFAFTARPADGSTGPDIYIWKVGDPMARPMTADHRSAFGSWTADGAAVGSTVDQPTAGEGDATKADVRAVSFLLDPATGKQVALPQTGRTWRPSVDPTGHRAVYWAGTLRLRPEVHAYAPSGGRLVIGDWEPAAPSPSESPTPTQLSSGQEQTRHETTIQAGGVVDWDARWDPTGTKLAIWIADPDDPEVGSLSLYDVDPFNGRIDLKKPLLDGTRADAGFSIADGKLVWAQPPSSGSGTGGSVLVLAWTDQGAGTVETLSDQVVVIR